MLLNLKYILFIFLIPFVSSSSVLATDISQYNLKSCKSSLTSIESDFKTIMRTIQTNVEFFPEASAMRSNELFNAATKYFDSQEIGYTVIGEGSDKDIYFSRVGSHPINGFARYIYSILSTEVYFSPRKYLSLHESFVGIEMIQSQKNSATSFIQVYLISFDQIFMPKVEDILSDPLFKADLVKLEINNISLGGYESKFDSYIFGSIVNISASTPKSISKLVAAKINQDFNMNEISSHTQHIIELMRKNSKNSNKWNSNDSETVEFLAYKLEKIKNSLKLSVKEIKLLENEDKNYKVHFSDSGDEKWSWIKVDLLTTVVNKYDTNSTYTFYVSKELINKLGTQNIIRHYLEVGLQYAEKSYELIESLNHLIKENEILLNSGIFSQNEGYDDDIILDKERSLEIYHSLLKHAKLLLY